VTLRRKRGHAKKCLWTDEKVAAIISLGVEFYNAWAHEHAGGDRQVRKPKTVEILLCLWRPLRETRAMNVHPVVSQALAAADEIAQLPSLSALLSVQDCVFGQYSSDAIGLTLAQVWLDVNPYVLE
jgi:hypothetical protein